MALQALLGGRPKEGQFTKAIEWQTARIPSGAYLAAATAAMLVSALFKARDRNGLALFFGQWPAPLLLMGLYNKLVKVHGSD